MYVYIHVSSGILLSDEKDWKVDTHNSVGGSHNTYAEWQKPNKNEFNDSTHMKSEKAP